MSFSFDLYIERESWLHRLDPRVKLLSVVLGTALLLVFNNLFIMIGALLLLHGIILSARIPRSRIQWVWQMMLPITVLIPCLWLIFYHEGGRLLLSFWFIRVSTLNIFQGLTVALRVDALAFVFFVWLFSTDQATLVRSLVKLGLPYEWGLVLAIALRYLPTFFGVFTMISEAQQARALDLTRGSLLKRLRAYMPILVAMIITALRTSENLARALEARAFGAGVSRRTYLRDLRFRPADYWVAAGLLLAAAALLWARFALGLGMRPLQLF